MDTKLLKYLQGYPSELIEQVNSLIDQQRLPEVLLRRYPEQHEFNNDRLLYQFTMTLKNRYLKQSAPLSKVIYDDRIDVINNALGLHTAISRVQGGKLKAKKEIRIASLFKQAPEPMLRMITVHELAHLKEKDHNRAFYKLCRYMETDYHQLELDTRLYLTCIERFGPLY